MAYGRVAGEPHDLGDHLLAEVVGGVGLAGEHQLQGARRVEQQGAEPLGLRQQQGGPLVGSEPAGETDDQ